MVERKERSRIDQVLRKEENIEYYKLLLLLSLNIECFGHMWLM